MCLRGIRGGQFVQWVVMGKKHTRFGQQLDNSWLLVLRPNLPAVHQTIHVIDFFIRPVSPVVLPQVFDGSDRQNEDDRSQSEFWLKRIDNWNKIQQSDENKVNIGKPMKLLKKILWQERQHSVLGSLNLVVCIVSVWVFLPFGVVIQRVCVDDPGFVLLSFLLSLPLDFWRFGHPGVFALPRHSQSPLQTFPQSRFSCPLIQNKHKVPAMLSFFSRVKKVFASLFFSFVHTNNSASSMSTPLFASRRGKTFACLASLFFPNRWEGCWDSREA